MHFSQGYKPEPERQGPLAILSLAIVTCVGTAGIVLWTIVLASKF